MDPTVASMILILNSSTTDLALVQVIIRMAKADNNLLVEIRLMATCSCHISEMVTIIKAHLNLMVLNILLTLEVVKPLINKR